MIGETEFSLNYGLALLAHVHTLTEQARIFLEEQEREAGDQLLLACRENLHLVFQILVVIFENFDRSPDVIFVFIDWG